LKPTPFGIIGVLKDRVDVVGCERPEDQPFGFDAIRKYPCAPLSECCAL
jgi:hypothetical protein